MADANFLIRTEGLNKRFKKVHAVKDLELKVRKGDIYGFLGPNGAGKTTTIKMILDLVHPDTGNVFIDGKNTSEWGVEFKRGIGYMPERTQFYRNLTAIQTMHFFAELKGVGKGECDELLARMGLAEWRDAKVGTFSKGMVQLMGIGQSLLGSPKLLILDEPTSGLDPRWARVLKDIILEVNGKGTTVFFSSHLLFEVQELCSRVAILKNGALIIEDSTSKVSQDLTHMPKLVLRISGDAGKAAKILFDNGFKDVKVHGQNVTVICESARKAQVMSLLSQANIIIEDFKTEEPSLEDAFIRLIDAGKGGGSR
jgi:ABC-type multidrug transport system ATPase subunit